MPGPDIIPSKCDGCGLCVGVCINDGLVIEDGRAVFVGGDLCIWCTICEASCDRGALRCPYEVVVDEPKETSDIQP